MDSDSKMVFLNLFREAVAKCFGHPLQQPLTETESKQLYNQILEATGLVVGWKSLKNYSLFVLNENGKAENPSTATLDTLARYVLNIPYTTESDRNNQFSHWFKYKEAYFKENKPAVKTPKTNKSFLIPAVICSMVILAAFFFYFHFSKAKSFSTNFHSVSEDSLLHNGWFVKDKDDFFWKKRDEKPGFLSLFTLTGDNWLDSIHQPQIKNLLLRKINADCFTAEVHLQHFFPQQEWQQAGVLLMEDTSYSAKTLRLSLAYNDNFGGFSNSKEVIIQAIISPGNGLSHPEEVAHVPVFTLDSSNESIIRDNLTYSGLRVEKSGEHIRLLYSCSAAKNFAFKDAATLNSNFHPKYIGIFALQGFVDNKNYEPVYFSSFLLAPQSCQ